VEILKRSTYNIHLVSNFPIIEETFIPFSLDEYISIENKLVYAGTVYPNSLQENMLEAFDGVDPVKYIIVGSIDVRYLNRLTAHKLWHKVQFIKRVPKEELIKIYNEAVAGVILFDYSPNVGYKQGTLGNNKIFEYMQSALPVICTDFVLWKKIIDKYKCGIYVNPHNINEIRNAVKYLLENKEEAYKMGQNGRLAVLKEYNWNSPEKAYINIFNEIVAKHNLK
jgi:glycosyltransferase involved in cell wall biosynthesis